MAKFTQSQLDRIKRELKIKDLAEEQGLKLARKNGQFVTRCLWHRDNEPSLFIHPGKNLFNCFGCDAGGDSIQWIMKSFKMEFARAVEYILNRYPHLEEERPKESPEKTKTETCPLDMEVSDQKFLQQVIEFYHQRLLDDYAAQDYLMKRGILDNEAIKVHKIGFADRDLGRVIPDKNSKRGRDLRERLTDLGIYRKSGHGHFNGCIVFPVIDCNGNVREIYGRKINDNLRKGSDYHLYLAKEARLFDDRGIWNEKAFRVHEEMILCESIIDAMSFWCAGYKNVTCLYGTQTLSDELQAALASRTKTVFLAFDRDRAGELAVKQHSKTLLQLGINVYRIDFPVGLDANDYATSFKAAAGEMPAHDTLGLVIRNAVWLGTGEPIEIKTSAPDNREVKAPAATHKNTTQPKAAKEKTIETDQHDSTLNGKTASNDDSSKAAKEKTIETDQHDSTLNGKTASNDDSSKAAKEKTIETDQRDSTLNGKAASNGDSTKAAIESEQETPLKTAKPTNPGSVAAGSNCNSIQADDKTATETLVDANLFSLAADVVEPTATRKAPNVPVIEAEIKDNEIAFAFGDREYRVRGIEKNHSYDTLKINLLCRRGESFHVDTFDLYQSRPRSAFIKIASMELGFDESIIKRDLGQILLKLEQLQEDQIQSLLENSKSAEVKLEPAAKEEALQLLKDENLLDRILQDFSSCGVVGEENNKLIGYLAAVSRKLNDPLAVLIQSSSAAGKSSLMDAILAFVPEEDKVIYSAMTGQSLYYMGGGDLKHKILAISEEEGVRQATYALKLLQSEGKLCIASTGKDPNTGRMETQEYTVEGPVMIFLTTTSYDIDEELQNRCLILFVCENQSQTQAIHEIQRKRQTLDGLLSDQNRSAIRTVHQNAQRLLKPLLVANNYAEELKFRSDRTRTRRDHAKYLTLIRVIALLHQHQREIKTVEHNGKTIEYIEVTRCDIAKADELAAIVLSGKHEELPERTQFVLTTIHELLVKACDKSAIQPIDFRFTRRELRELTGMGNTQLKLHLDRLEDLEYISRAQRSGANHKIFYSVLEFESNQSEGQTTDYDVSLSGVNGSLSGRFRAAFGGGDRKRKPGSDPEKNGKSDHAA